jgi:hypothetical protein
VYVECSPSEPTGLYVDNISKQVEHFGYASEEFAVFQGRYINLNEANDGATVVNGEPVSTEGQAEFRVRYLSPYNFIIAPQRVRYKQQRLRRALGIRSQRNFERNAYSRRVSLGRAYAAQTAFVTMAVPLDCA